jgi:expansin (peptidoglycan-binding protein)
MRNLSVGHQTPLAAQGRFSVIKLDVHHKGHWISVAYTGYDVYQLAALPTKNLPTKIIALPALLFPSPT